MTERVRIPSVTSRLLDEFGALSRPWSEFFQRLTKVVSKDDRGNSVAGVASIATTATDGFLYVPTCAGVPTGVPTTYTGFAPVVVDTTNNRLYFYSSGSWRNAGP